jgi:hypothetical protein
VAELAGARDGEGRARHGPPPGVGRTRGARRGWAAAMVRDGAEEGTRHAQRSARGGRGAGARLAREGLAGGQRAGHGARRGETRQGARATRLGEGRVQGKKKGEGGGRERREGEGRGGEGKTHLQGSKLR